MTKKMTKNFKILAEFVKDMSSETADAQTYMFVKENILKYHLDIDIKSMPLKNGLIEVNTSLKFEDKKEHEKKSYFEIVYASIIKIEENIKDKEILEKIILCDLQNEIYPNLEKAFLNLLHNSGFSEVKLEKKIDFNKLYEKKIN